MILPALSFAQIPSWDINLETSNLSFTATQNNAPAAGSFKSFTASVEFDKENLEKSKVKVIIDMRSVYADYEDLVLTLKMPEWFDVEKFPEATFESTKFSKSVNGTYQAEGNLTIRDKTKPVIIDFTIKKYTEKELIIEGETTIKRTDFGIGQGEWASTDEVKDPVRIHFKLQGLKQ